MLKHIDKMAWFNKNKKGEMKEQKEMPSLPQLPQLPDLPSDNFQFKPNMLPRFPQNSLGDKFSQDTIKDAVSGEKEDEMTNEPEEIQAMPKPPMGPLTREAPPEMEEPFEEEMPSMSRGAISSSRQKAEPMFVRLDKFEESLGSFDKIKKQLSGVEKLLESIKSTKEEESREIEAWQSKLQTMKNQVDKIDRDIFSRIE
jgi:hypothetical protein